MLKYILLAMLLAFPAMAGNNIHHNNLNGNKNTNANTTGGNTVQGGDYDGNASSAYARAPRPSAPCQGGTAVGGQGLSFGFSVGTSWTDTECKILREADELKRQGEPAAAREVLCELDRIRSAFKRVGKPCLSDANKASAMDYKDSTGEIYKVSWNGKSTPVGVLTPVASPNQPRSASITIAYKESVVAE